MVDVAGISPLDETPPKWLRARELSSLWTRLSAFPEVEAPTLRVRLVNDMRFESLRTPLFGIAALAMTTWMGFATACGGGDDESTAARRSEKTASTAFYPVDPAEQPNLPPGAGPYTGPGPEKAPTSSPTDGGSSNPTDAGASPKDAAGD